MRRSLVPRNFQFVRTPEIISRFLLILIVQNLSQKYSVATSSLSIDPIRTLVQSICNGLSPPSLPIPRSPLPSQRFLTSIQASPIIYMIRHGEKPPKEADGKDADGLSAQGVDRSQYLRNVFGP